MKPWIRLIAAGTLGLALTACGGDSDADDDATAAGGGDKSTAQACQEWTRFLMDEQPDDYDNIYPAVADKAEELAGEVEDADLAEALTKASEANREAAEAIAAGEAPDVEGTLEVMSGIGDVCGASM